MDQKSFEKKVVGEFAASYVKDGMTVGLGTGSTVAFLIKKLGERVQKENLHIRAVSTSSSTSELARSVNIRVLDLNDVPSIDLTIDGVDEFDPKFNGIKGGGGALLYEKIVASASDYNIWIADASKKAEALGTFPLPVEVLPFGYKHTLRELEAMELSPEVRYRDGDIYITDSHHYIIDCHVKSIPDPEELSRSLNSLPGVMENGLFIGIVDEILIADGTEVKKIKK